MQMDLSYASTINTTLGTKYVCMVLAQNVTVKTYAVLQKPCKRGDVRRIQCAKIGVNVLMGCAKLRKARVARYGTIRTISYMRALQVYCDIEIRIMRNSLIIFIIVLAVGYDIAYRRRRIRSEDERRPILV